MIDWGFTIGSYVFNIIDVAIVVLAFMGAVVGSARGFAMEFSARAGFLIGIIIALFFTRLGASMIMENFDLPIIWSTLIAFVVLFIVGYAAMMLIGTLLDKTLDALMLDWLDRLLGFFLGIAETLVVVAFVIYLLQMQSVVDMTPYFSNSVIFENILKPIAPKSLELFKELL
jgi:membrane protein required for colicin V production